MRHSCQCVRAPTKGVVQVVCGVFYHYVLCANAICTVWAKAIFSSPIATHNRFKGRSLGNGSIVVVSGVIQNLYKLLLNTGHYLSVKSGKSSCLLENRGAQPGVSSVSHPEKVRCCPEIWYHHCIFVHVFWQSWEAHHMSCKTLATIFA